VSVPRNDQGWSGGAGISASLLLPATLVPKPSAPTLTLPRIAAGGDQSGAPLELSSLLSRTALLCYTTLHALDQGETNRRHAVFRPSTRSTSS
jgi:hypothetical protein